MNAGSMAIVGIRHREGKPLTSELIAEIKGVLAKRVQNVQPPWLYDTNIEPLPTTDGFHCMTLKFAHTCNECEVRHLLQRSEELLKHIELSQHFTIEHCRPI